MRVSRLLPLAFWLSAWAAWLWLSVGLHRELPRDWGPAMSKVPATFAGFVHDSDVVVVRSPNRGFDMRCFDARSGARLHDSVRMLIEGESGVISMRHGFAVGVDVDALEKDPRNNRLKCFDFRTGGWIDLGFESRRIFDVHPERPLIALRLESGPQHAPRVGIVDAPSGRTLGVWESPPPPAGALDFLQHCSFTGEDDEVVLWIERNGAAERGSSGISQRFEHWSPSKGRVGDAVKLRRVTSRVSKAANGRIVAIGFGGRTDAFEVLDHRTGATLLSSDAQNLDLGGQRRTYPLDPQLSKSGRAMLGRSNCLWSVDERRPLWRGSDFHEHVLITTPDASRFGVLEDWRWLLKHFRIDQQAWTFAVRDFETGSVVFRAWGTGPNSNDFSRAVRYALLKRDLGDPTSGEAEHVVVSATPNVNWTMLAICQTVLAAPIVLLWLLLRWRRKRNLRTSGGSHPPETTP